MTAHDPRPLVSIQIPTYNRPELLAQALRSALDQTYENIEVVVSDDAGSAENEAAVRDVAAGDSRVRYLPQPVNLGSLGNSLAVYRASRGSYLKLLCDDDLLAPTHVETLLAPMLKDPRVTLAFSYYQYIDTQGSTLPDPPGLSRLTDEPTLLHGPEYAHKGLAHNTNVVGSTTATLFARRRLALPHMSRFGGVTISPYATDWAIWLSLLAAGPAFYTPETLSWTRDHPARATHDPAHALDSVNDLLLIHEHWATHGPDIDRMTRLPALHMLVGMALHTATIDVGSPRSVSLVDVAARAVEHIRQLQADGPTAVLSTTPRVSIVVDAGQDGGRLARQLTAVGHHTAGAAIEIVLVLSASSGSEVRALVAQQGEDAVVVEAASDDRRAVRAAGAGAAGHPRVVLLEPGVLPQPGWLPRLLDTTLDDGVEVGCSGLVDDDRGHLIDDPGDDWGWYEYRDVTVPYAAAVLVVGAARAAVVETGHWPPGSRIVCNPTSWVRIGDAGA